VFGTGNDGVELLLGGLGGTSNVLLGDGVVDFVVFGGFGGHKLAIEEVGVDSLGEAEALETGKGLHC
jgi:hypothetical protein